MRLWVLVLAGLLWVMSGRLMAADTVEGVNLHVRLGSLPELDAPYDAEFRVYYGFVILVPDESAVEVQYAPEDRYLSVKFDTLDNQYNYEYTLSGDFGAWTGFTNWYNDGSYGSQYLNSAVVGGRSADLSVLGGSGSFRTPEPAAAGMLAVGSLCLLARKSRRV